MRAKQIYHHNCSSFLFRYCFKISNRKNQGNSILNILCRKEKKNFQRPLIIGSYFACASRN